ncbi:Pr6Pr family membrane protein [Actinoplanes sp. NPDC051859]|uniref:Pr6Pr family membrane protein n=1 Tax=Actinoplanes sp. NPDC051859 TaxID=3363909 RepID=UPI0037A66D12
MLRILAVIAVVTGVVLDATGTSTLTGLLPYFTIQSNVLYGIFAAYALFQGRNTNPVLKGAVTLYVAITGLVFHLVLDNPASGFANAPVDRTPGEAVANQLLHTVVPLIAVADWLLFDEHRRFKVRYAAWWLAFPLYYLVFAMIRGLITDTYPYPFLDVHDLGYAGVAVSAVFFAVAFWLLGLSFVGLDRLAHRVTGGRRAEADDRVSTT